jgi:uncharacterized protein
VLATGSYATIERTACAFLASSSGWAILALAPVPAKDLPRAVLDSLSGALDLGARMLAPGESPDAGRLAAASGGRVLATGRVLEVARRVGPGEHGRPGFGRGSVTLTDHRDGSLLEMEMETEME